MARSSIAPSSMARSSMTARVKARRNHAVHPHDDAMADEQRPTVRSRKLGMTLRRIREERGLSTHAAARLLNRSQASISKLETGHRGIHRPGLENMLDRY